jgi:hypothetical protein
MGMTTRKWNVAGCMLAMVLAGVAAMAESPETAFVYQGRLTDGLAAASGSYDFQFRLHDAAEDGALIGEAVARSNVDVAGGAFEVEMDFGHDLFTGDPCYLEIAVRPGEESGAYTALTPRQAFIPVPSAWAYPYAVYASEARSGVTGQGTTVTAIGIGKADGQSVSPLTATHGTGNGTNSVLHDNPVNVNTAEGDYSAVGGGGTNGAGSSYATVGGGWANAANGSHSTVSGGGQNNVGLASPYGTIGGGRQNDIAASVEYPTISGGRDNNIGSANYAAIGGGGYNDIGNGSGCSAIAGGYGNDISSSSGYCAIAGGNDNDVATGCMYGAIGGGILNDIENGVESAAIGGGRDNTCGGESATISGGRENIADKIYAAIAGGYLNEANGDGAAVGGGRYNEASGLYACVPGGRKNRAVRYSLAAGYRAKAANSGSFVWADSTEADLKTTVSNQFLVRAKGGMKFFTNAGMTTGVKLNPGGGSWVNLSDRESKENFEAVDAKGVLERLADVPVQTWNYKSQDASIRHMGPTSQDLYEAFSLGADDEGIATIDGIGIALAAAKGLYDLIRETQVQVQGLRQRLEKSGGKEGTKPLTVVAHTIGSGANSILHQGMLNTAAAQYSSVNGGYSNDITANGEYATVGGGSAADVDATWATVAGGRANKIREGATHSSVGGGFANEIEACAEYGAIAGGNKNTIGAYVDKATIGGGDDNETTADYATVAGGDDNTAGGIAATVGGGRYNEASGFYACVPGGRKNRAVAYSFAAGHRAKAANQGSFVWADSTAADLKTTAKNQFLARAKGGVKFFTNGTMTSGAKLNPGAGSWTNLSDRESKENFEAVDARDVLERLAEIPMRTWNYRSQDASIRHMGATSQDLHAAFGLGADDKGIVTVDGIGVTMAAVQGLNQKIDEREAEIQALGAKAREKDARIARMEKRIATLATQVERLGQRLGP